MTRRSRRPLRSDLNVHEKTTKDEGEFLESCDRTTKGWCKVFNENSLVPDLEQSVFRLDHMLLGNVNMTTTEGYKIRVEDIGKGEKLASPRQIRSSEKIRSRKSMEDLEAVGKDFTTNSLTCDGGVEAWKEGFNLDNRFVKEGKDNSLTVTLSVASNRSRESRKPGNLTSVENLYMELQNGESSGERFANPSGVSVKNGRLSNRLFDNDKSVKALCKAIEEAESINTSVSSHEFESVLTRGEQDSVARISSRPSFTKSYPRRNGIYYRNRVKSEEKELDEVSPCLNSLAVVCFVDEKNVTHNCVTTELEDEQKVDDSLISSEAADTDGNTVEEKPSQIISLPPKRQRRPPQSYSPSHGPCRMGRTPRSLTRKTTLSRQLCFSKDNVEPKPEINMEDSRTTVIKKKQNNDSKDKGKHETGEAEATVEPTNADNISYVLGVRRLYNWQEKNTESCQVLVQFKDGTSNWVSSEMLQNVQFSLGGFLCDNNQNIHVVNRLPYNMYCKAVPTTRSASTKNSVCSKKKERKQAGKKANDINLTIPKKEVVVDHVSPSNSILQNTTVNNTLSTETDIEKEVPPPKREENSSRVTLNKLPKSSPNKSISSDPLRSGMLTNILYNENISVPPTPAKEIEVTKHDTFVHIVVRSKHATKKNKRINTEICDKLIEYLEEYSVDDSVRLVVLSGLEDHFATKLDLYDVSRLPSWMEGHECKHSVLKLRYLFQTIRHYCKPLIGVISRPSRGLSASLLSMFDMVFDKERGVELFESTSQKAKELSVLFPRLMGLATKSEQLLMGDQANCKLEERLSQTDVLFRGTKYSYNLTESLKDVRGNCRKRHFPNTSPSKESSMIPTTSPENSTSIHPVLEKKRLKETDVIKKQIEREKELAKSCLQDISMFWRELRNQDVEEVLS